MQRNDLGHVARRAVSGGDLVTAFEAPVARISPWVPVSFLLLEAPVARLSPWVPVSFLLFEV